jgi:transposase
MTEQGMAQQVYWTIGVDCGEQKHRFVMLDERAERQEAMWVRNQADEIQEAFAKLMLMLPEEMKLRVVTEGLRSLGGIMVQVATAMGVEIWQVNPKALDHYRDLEGQPRKDDDRDAFLLGKMCINEMEGCRLAVDSRPEERVLCRLTRLHTQLVDQRTAAKNRFRSRLLELSPEVVDASWEGPVFNGKGMQAVLDRWPGFEGLERARLSTIERVLRTSTRYGSRCAAMAKELKEMAGRIVLCREEREVVTIELGILVEELRAIEVSLADVDKRIEANVRRHPIAVKLLEMPGEGPFSAGVDVGEVLPLARNVSEGKAATYAGTTPLSRRSGKKGRPSKLARGVNKHALRANYPSAVAARKASAIDDAYYHKQLKRHEGHPRAHVKANLALARQRFKVKYTLMTTDARYDKEILIASHLDRLRRNSAKQARPSAA